MVRRIGLCRCVVVRSSVWIVAALCLGAAVLAGCARATPDTDVRSPTGLGSGVHGHAAPPPSPSASIPTAYPTLAPPTGIWTTVLGVNEVHGLAFAPDGALWAATTGGVARWDLVHGTYTQYTAADGLASSYANDVALAPDGTVWVATLAGVSHLEGTTWTNYTTADGLADDAAQSISVAPGGAIWVGTLSGASRFDGQAWTSFLRGARAWKVAVGPDGLVWVANDGLGLSRYSPAGDSFTTYGTEQGLPGLGVKVVAVAPDGAVWIYIGYGSVYRHDGLHWQEVSGVTAPWVCDIAFDASGTPLIATCPGLHGGGYGLLSLGREGWERNTSGQGLGSDTVLAVAAGPDGLVAAGTMLGLSVCQDGQWRTLMGGPARNRVTAAAVTADGAVWLGFGDFSAFRAGGGASRFDGQIWKHFLADANVQLLAVDPRGTLWAGIGCDLQRWDGHAWTSVGGCDRLMGNVIDLAFAPDGAVWVASGMKLGRLLRGEWTFFDRAAHTVAVAPDGMMWIGGWKGTQGSEYSARFDGSTWVEFPGSVASLTVTPDGQVWAVAADLGLVRFDGRAWSAYQGPSGAGIDSIDWLAVGPDGSLWASGGGSLAHLDGSTWDVYAGAGAAAIAFAPDGSLWLGTSNGAVHFYPAD